MTDLIKREEVLRVVEGKIADWASSINARNALRDVATAIRSLPTHEGGPPVLPRTVTPQMGCPEMLGLLFRDNDESARFTRWVQGLPSPKTPELTEASQAASEECQHLAHFLSTRHEGEGEGCPVCKRESQIDAELERLREATKPFADCVFNDNHDVTIDESRLHISDWLVLRAALTNREEG